MYNLVYKQRTPKQMYGSFKARNSYINDMRAYRREKTKDERFVNMCLSTLGAMDTAYPGVKIEKCDQIRIANLTFR